MDIVYVAKNNKKLYSFIWSLAEAISIKKVYQYCRKNKRSVSGAEFWQYVNDNISEDYFLLCDYGIAVPPYIKCKKLFICNGTKFGELINSNYGLYIPNIDTNILYNKEAYIVSISNMVRNELILFYKHKPENIVTIDLGIKVNEIDICENNRDIKLQSSVPLVIGYLPFNEHIINKMSELQKLLPETRIVRLTDWEKIKDFDIYIHLPQYEGASIFCLNAIGEGVPLIVTETGIFKNSIMKLPKFISVVDCDFSVEDLKHSVEMLHDIINSSCCADLCEYVQFIEDNFSIEGFKEEWEMLVKTFCETGSFDKYREWAKNGQI